MRIQKKGGLAAWQARYLSAVVLSMASAAVVFGPGLASGADAPEASDKLGNFDQAIADLRQEAGQDRRDIVKANMLLTASEGNTFWPLYDEYRNERNALNDKKVALIKDFLSKRDTMSQDDAEKLTKQFFEQQKDTVSLKEKYWSRMNKVLSARTTSRFFQIDQKLDAAVDLVIAIESAAHSLISCGTEPDSPDGNPVRRGSRAIEHRHGCRTWRTALLARRRWQPVSLPMLQGFPI